MARNRFIKAAIKHPGALRAQAKKAGALTPSGTISRDWLAERAKEGGKVGRRARLAITLRRLGGK